jgi:two-component system, NtrC family, nitrogen regulation response regulator NtrX
MPSKNIPTQTVLVIDDDKSVRNALTEILLAEGYKVDEAVDGKAGYNLLKSRKYGCALCDIKMPLMDGMEVLELSQKNGIDVPMIMISGHGSTDIAVEAVRKGAFDYISKPPDLNRLLITIRNAMERNLLIEETETLKFKFGGLKEIIGESEEIALVKKTIDRVGPSEAKVLITGGNGSGKELVARWIHQKSNRSNAPLVEVNCAAIPSELIDSELFGHEKGSFTSAINKRIGKFEQANGGTLFLDEIGDMSLSAQAKVLRALQEGKITRVGGEKDIDVDVRILTATNKDLTKEIELGNFRLDLLHRLNVIQIHVPDLNNRRNDIPILAAYFLKQICAEYNRKELNMADDAYLMLKNYNWTGNIRELRNVIERLIILCDHKITVADIEKYVHNTN